MSELQLFSRAEELALSAGFQKEFMAEVTSDVITRKGYNIVRYSAKADSTIYWEVFNGVAANVDKPGLITMELVPFIVNLNPIIVGFSVGFKFQTEGLFLNTGLSLPIANYLEKKLFKESFPSLSEGVAAVTSFLLEKDFKNTASIIQRRYNPRSVLMYTFSEGITPERRISDSAKTNDITVNI